MLFALAVIAQVGTTTTSTPAAASIDTASTGDALDALLDEIGDAPLTEDELALLAELETRTATVVTATVTHPEGVRPRTLVTRRSLIATGARSLREALESLPVPWVSARMVRRRVLLEDVLLPPFMEGLLDSDVRAFGRVTVSPRSSRMDHASGAHGTVAIYGVEPELGLDLEAAAEGRSADRSSGLYGAIGGGLDRFAVRGSLSYDDRRALRTPRGDSAYGKGERWVASIRGVIGGDYVLRGAFGADLDRAQNVRTFDASGDFEGIMPLDQRLFSFARIELGEGAWGVSLVGSYHRLDQSFEIEGVRLPDLDAEGFQGRLVAYLRPVEWLTVRGGAHVAASSGNAPLERSHREAEGFLALELASDHVEAIAGARLSYQRSEGTGVLQALRVLPEIALFVPIAGPFGARAGFDMGMTVPGDILLAPAGSLPETTVSLEGGPSLRGPSYGLDLFAFASWIEHPLAFVPDATVRPGRIETSIHPSALRLVGLELDGSVRFGPVEISATGQIAEAVQNGLSTRIAPVASGLLAARYLFGARRAFVEARIRGASRPLEIFGDETPSGPPSMIAGQPLRAFGRLGVAGGLDLGLGFEAHLAVENALDRPYQLQSTAAPGGGIDLRATVSYRY